MTAKVSTAQQIAVNALDSSPGESPGGLFIGVVRGSSNNVWTAPVTASFTLSAQSQGYYSHFTPLTTWHQAYYKATHVFPSQGLHPMMSSGPSALDCHPTSITTFITGLHWPITALITVLRRHGCSWPPLPSSCQVVKQRMVHELAIAKLLMLGHAGGVIGAEARVSPRVGKCEAQCV
jgi:hypothetical protein